MMKENLASPKRIVNIRNIRALDFVEMAGDGALRIGPLSTLATVAAHAQAA